MARNKTLLSLLQDFRVEIGASGNPAHNRNTRDTQVHLIQRNQELLWESHDWPHLRVRREVPLQAGQRYYDTPDDMIIDRVERIDVRYSGDWCCLQPGITNAHYASWDSDTDERSWPVEAWRVFEDEQVEIWPIPSDNAETDSKEGTLRFTGIRSPRPLVADDDRADLDDRLIVLHAAGEYLTSKGDKRAPLVLQAAAKRLSSLTANMSKVKQFSLFGSSGYARRPAPIPRVHYRDKE